MPLFWTEDWSLPPLFELETLAELSDWSLPAFDTSLDDWSLPLFWTEDWSLPPLFEFVVCD
ncbi:MAG: hypothetical protein EOP67_04530 [Sphingomonas sp.]|nr:MAG: hypothetical protein EOP67_04530 [Sphingomonas sp.]